ncbi:MAG: HAMP domain-containing histidine kinase [Spirochaetes bacterium]|nr:HAMP domain-containing histidine kinase [Spirochaetota bacterium]
MITSDMIWIFSLIILLILSITILLHYRFSLEKILQILKKKEQSQLIRLKSSPKVIQKLSKEINELIKEQKDLRIQQKEFEKIRSQFLSSVSHDIRTPLTSIIGYLDAVKDDHKEKKELNVEYLAILANKSGELKNRIDQFFELAKLQSADWKMKPLHLDIAEVIREVIIDFLPVFKKEKIKLDLQLPEKKIYVLFDQLSLIRILENLVQNVIIHADSCYLGILLNENQDAYILSVTDQGKGLTQEQVTEIFQRSRYLSSSRHSSGLGLTIVRQLAELNQAVLTVESQLDKGSAFILTILKK